MKGGPANPGQLSWIGASITLGALIGTIFAGYFANCMGKKRTLMILALPNFGFWVLTYFAISVKEIIIGRFIGGITGKNNFGTESPHQGLHFPYFTHRRGSIPYFVIVHRRHS